MKPVPRNQGKLEISELSPNDYLVWVEPVSYSGHGPSSQRYMVKISSNSKLKKKFFCGVIAKEVF